MRNMEEGGGGEISNSPVRRGNFGGLGGMRTNLGGRKFRGRGNM